MDWGWEEVLVFTAVSLVLLFAASIVLGSCSCSVWLARQAIGG
jgi:hypothetical protein